MKKLYSFNIYKKEEIETEEQTENGKLVKKEILDVPYKITIKYPSRQELEEADDIYAVKYADCIRKKMLPKALVAKVYGNDHGFLSDPEVDKYSNAFLRISEIQNDYTRLSLKDKKTPEDEEKIKNLIIEFGALQREVQSLESLHNSVYENTAETKAQRYQMTWFTFFLTHISKNKDKQDEYSVLFDGHSLDNKLDQYDEILEKDDEEAEFYRNIVDKASFFVALWVMGKAASEEDFKQFDLELNAEIEDATVDELQDENQPSEDQKEPVDDVAETEKPAKSTRAKKQPKE